MNVEMENKIKEIKDLYDYDGLFNLYYEWLDNNNYDRPLDKLEAESYLSTLDIEEISKNLKDLDLNDYDYYEFSGYGYLSNIGNKYEVIDGRALCEPEFVDYVYEGMKEGV